MSLPQRAALALIVPIAVSLVGCTSTTEAAGAASSSVVSAAETCAGLGDAGTVLINAGNAEREQRAGAREVEGAVRLAARMYLRVPADAGTDLGARVEEMKSLIDAVPLGAVQVPFDHESREWSETRQALITACEEAGAPLAVECWTGG